MKRLTIFFLLLCTSLMVRAGHIAGGEIYYTYLGAGAAPNTDKYEITLRLFRECNPPPAAGGTMISAIPPSVRLGIYVNSTPSQYYTERNIDRTSFEQITLASPGPCIVNAPEVCYQVGGYTVVVELPHTESGYVVAFQTCCRTNGIANIAGASVGATYTADIPPSLGSSSIKNSSAVFLLRDTTLVCTNLDFTLDFGAIDPDGDSLTYSFCSAFNGGNARDASLITPSNPPYGTISYANFFSGDQPLGRGVSINSSTGLISGTAPAAGSYVINVCVNEYRNGRLISVHRKDFTLKIGNCSISQARLPQPGYPTLCESLTYSFENLSSSSNITSYLWEFYDPAAPSDTSTQPLPTHTYSDTGIFKIKLTVRSSSGCADSSTSIVRVFPGFDANFDITGSCFLTPFQFSDRTTTTYGSVDSWRWNFGDLSSAGDTSRTKNATYKYADSGMNTVQLIATNTKGCIDTITKIAHVKTYPLLTLPFTDTLICSIDTLPLIAQGTGIFSWLPNYNIISPNTSNPLVYPKTTTSYIVTLNENGCVATDTIKVNVLDFITADAGADTSICRTDSFTLQPQTQGLQFTWSPAAGLNNSSIKNPVATPLTSTMYLLKVNLGKCFANDSIMVHVAPYPQANAGQDASICYGNRTQLNASIVGASFTWSPVNSLLNSTTLTPLAAPTTTTSYILSVYDTIGCPKPFYDTVVVKVIPPVNAFAGNDTIIVANQPLQLTASGGTFYSWSPAVGMNNSFIANPLIILNQSFDSVKYSVRVETPEGCFDTDDMVVKVFKTGPDIFIPSAFTPNSDGRNDIVKPIPVGMKAIGFFRIYNRWGQLLYSTSQIGRGWDGTYAGVPQASGTYVYMAEATDYLDKKVFRKGTVVLIR